MKFAVLGGGSAGQGIAGYLALKGHKINLYNRTPEKIASIVGSGNLKVSGVIKGNAKIEKASSDMREILGDVGSILVAVRAFGHESIIKESLTYIKKNATIVVFTGYWAALRLRSILSREQRNDIAIAETTLLPLASEIVEEGH
ncbi:MAG TPA: NADP transhydrogenase subunit alpha, partial [Thermoplasmatales archaeon]|nr:NADP transhydrogenase subunit alpha [Thermoplasmatales archaeon]